MPSIINATNNSGLVTAPDNSGILQLQANGVTQVTVSTEGAKFTTIQDHLANTATASNVMGGAAKAWVSFKGSGTVAIKESFNVTSITDNGTGDYSINFAYTTPSNNFAAMGSASYDTSGFGPVVNIHSVNASPWVMQSNTAAIRILTYFPTIGLKDPEWATLAIFHKG